MISKQSNSECYVYITLPRETNSVTAGRFELTRNRRGDSIGRFVYGRTYLARTNAVEIDPIDLKLEDSIYTSTLNNGVFNSLRDASPDFWGRILIERHSGRSAFGEIDYLLESPDDRAGALGFGLNQKPPAPLRRFNKTIELERLQSIAEKILREQIDQHDHETVQAQELMLIGTSMGGARPKTVVEDDHGLWIAKFSRPDDRWNNPRVEFAMLELARICDINVARSRVDAVGGKDVLLVQRFDREKTSQGYIRARMISGLSVLRASDSALQRDRWSYVFLAEELRRFVAQPKRDLEELFRRMCFNALISNTDDHPRNHALIAFDRDWRLSPAYDLTPSPMVSLERRDLAMTCGDAGRFAKASNLLSQCSRFLLDKAHAEKIVSTMTKQVRENWYSTVRACGVSVHDAEAIKDAFAYIGFDSDLQ